VETYGLFRAKNSAARTELFDIPKKKNAPAGYSTDIGALITEIDTKSLSFARFWQMACKLADNASVMIQHFGGFIDLASASSSLKHTDLPACLFQVYFVLDCLRDIYTHYDLHNGNVGLYKPYEGEKYIQFQYHYMDGTVVSFPSEYIVKIIDYGRNFFRRMDTKQTTDDVMEVVCAMPKKCPKWCGNKVGFGSINGERGEPEGSYSSINPSVSNCSFDLRLAHIYRRFLIDNGFLTQVVFQDPAAERYSGYSTVHYGTPPIKTNTYVNGNKVVSNVSDMAECLKQNLERWTVERLHRKYWNWTKMGEIHVYQDGREMRWKME